VNFRPIISEFTLLKRAIFAAIRPQFDDDLHSSRYRFQTDWKIAILISAEYLKLKKINLPTSLCRTGVRAYESIWTIVMTMGALTAAMTFLHLMKIW